MMKSQYNNIVADYEFWVKFDHWDIEQICSLLLGYNPLYLNHQFIKEQENLRVANEFVPIIEEYKKMHQLVIDAVRSGSIKPHETPIKCYKWAVKKELPIFTEFRNTIESIGKAPKVEHNTYNNPKRNKQLYKIVLSMAIKYKYNPDSAKNPSTAKFRDAIERAGLEIDDNTIRDVVNKSYDLFSDKIDHSIFRN